MRITETILVIATIDVLYKAVGMLSRGLGKRASIYAMMDLANIFRMRFRKDVCLLLCLFGLWISVPWLEEDPQDYDDSATSDDECFEETSSEVKAFMSAVRKVTY